MAVESKAMGPRFTIGGFGNSFYIREAGKGPVSGLTNLSREGAEAALAKLYDDPLQDAIRNNRDGIAERIIENAFKDRNKQYKPMKNEESTRNQSLYEIGDELNAIADAFDAAEESGEESIITDAFEAYFAKLLDDRDNKLDRYASLIAFTENQADGAEKEAKRCAELAKVRKNRVTALKERLKTFFEIHGITKIETVKHVFTVAGNGGKMPLVVDEGVKPEDVPECFRKVILDFDKDEIRNAIEGGQDVQFARLGERGTHLRIK